MKITLITCTYNAEAVLQRTLNSVLKQSYREIEHIIIDGKSKDGTVSIAQQYKAQNDLKRTGHKVVIVSEPDKGLYDAMNKGIGMATGDYLCFLNAGDCLKAPPSLPQGEELFYTFADDNAINGTSPLGRPGGAMRPGDGSHFSVIYGETDIVDENGNFLRHRRLRAPEHLTWRSFRHGMLVCHQSFYANTAIAKRTPYNLKYKLSADVDWCIRIMKEGERLGMQTYNTHQVLCNYLAGGMSVQNHRASLRERFDIMVDHYGLFTTIMQHMWFVIRSLLKK